MRKKQNERHTFDGVGRISAVGFRDDGIGADDDDNED